MSLIGPVLWMILIGALILVTIQFVVDGWRDHRRKKRGEL